MNEHALYAIYHKDIESYAYYFSRHIVLATDNSIELDDIKQEIGIALLKAARSYKRGAATFSSYFYQVSKNHMADLMRCLVSGTKHNIRSASDEGFKTVPLEEANSVLAHDLIHDLETYETIKSLLAATLLPRDAQIVTSYFGLESEDGQGKTCAEVGVEFGISRQRVDAILKRALSSKALVTGMREVFRA